MKSLALPERLPQVQSTYDPDTGLFLLTSDFRIEIGGYLLLVPTGFEFSATVPKRIAHWFPPLVLGLVGPLIHDFLYDRDGQMRPGDVAPLRQYSRKEADLIFLDCMRKEGVGRLWRTAAYRAVRTFGFLLWNQ